MKYTMRRAGAVTILDLSGRITLRDPRVGDEGAVLLDVVRETLAAGNWKILLNLRDVSYIDSSGLGQLVASFSAVRKEGGDLRVSGASAQVAQLLNITKLSAVLGAQPDEAAALQAMGEGQKKVVA